MHSFVNRIINYFFQNRINGPLTQQTKLHENEASDSVKRLDFFIKVLKEMIEHIEPNYINNLHWYTFGIKIAKKFLIQSITLQTSFLVNVSYDGEPDENRIIDFSSMFILLRSLSETYAMYYHFFIRCKNIEENIIRFRLWELDGYLSRQKRYRNLWSDADPKLIEEDEYIQKIKDAVTGLSFFKNLEKKKQEYLLNNAAWRFTSESLSEKESRKWNPPIAYLLKNTSMKEQWIENMYHEYSTHTHSGFLSIVENEKATRNERIQHEQMGILLASFIICFMIDDLKKPYKGGKEYYESLSPQNRSVIESFLTEGKK